MKLKIKITKEVLEATKMCDTGTWKLKNSLNNLPSQNCAISYACQEIFPQCDVWETYMDNSERFDKGIDKDRWMITLPQSATEFIKGFDNLPSEKRVKMNPFEFEVDVPQDVIDLINIDDIKNSKTLEIV